jgi:hypothetical protein
MQRQKYILRDLLRRGSIPQEGIRHAEHHRLVSPHQSGESIFRQGVFAPRFEQLSHSLTDEYASGPLLGAFF